MAGIYVTLELTKLHALVGRLQSHVDELAGRPELPPEITTDVKTATGVIDELSQYLETLVAQLPPSDEGFSRASHHSP